MKTFCFDIDGVICKTNGNNYKNSKPNKKVIKIINNLFKKNYIILYTARFMGRTNNNKKKAELLCKKMTLTQLKQWKVNYNKIYFGKPSYDFVIDDKSIFLNPKLNKNINTLLKKSIKL